MATSPEDALKSMIANMPEKTGKSLEEWVAIAKASGLEKHGVIVKYLKADHSMTHGFANLVAATTLKGDAPVDLVAAQYSGGKVELKPIHDALVQVAKGFGGDVEIAPKKGSVSLRRSKQFALITPATKTRIDLGINLKGVEPQGCLEAASGMCTHRIRLTSVGDMTSEVINWMRQAYDKA